MNQGETSVRVAKYDTKGKIWNFPVKWTRMMRGRSQDRNFTVNG